MSSPLKFTVAILACVFIGSCRNNLNTPMEQADIISDLSTTNIDDKDLSKPAIITGHIKNRHLYPDEKEVRITIPFYGRVPYTTLISPIWNDDTFSFQFFPYATRQISMPPYAEEIIISLVIQFTLRLILLICSAYPVPETEPIITASSPYSTTSITLRTGIGSITDQALAMRHCRR